MFDVVPDDPDDRCRGAWASLAEPPDDGHRAELDKALLDHKVLFFRDQHITTDQHVAFCRQFGELEVHPFVPPKPGYPEVMVLIANEERKGNENTWHSDVTWRQEPSLGSMLRAVELPDVGGDTLFADMEAAFDGLDDADARHGRRPHRGARLHPGVRSVPHRPRSSPSCTRSTRRPSTRSSAPIRSPGRRSIYVNAAFTSHIVGLRHRRERPAAAATSTAQAVDPRAPVPLPLGARLVRALGQPLRPALRGERLLPEPPGDGAGHHRRRPSALSRRARPSRARVGAEGPGSPRAVGAVSSPHSHSRPGRRRAPVQAPKKLRVRCWRGAFGARWPERPAPTRGWRPWCLLRRRGPESGRTP